MRQPSETVTTTVLRSTDRWRSAWPVARGQYKPSSAGPATARPRPDQPWRVREQELRDAKCGEHADVPDTTVGDVGEPLDAEACQSRLDGGHAQHARGWVNCP